MNRPESQRDIGDTTPTSKFYDHSPRRDVDAVEAWRVIFWKEEEEHALEAEEIAHFAAHPALLADAMAKDLMVIQTNGLRCVYQNWGLWCQSPLLQSQRYYRLLAALLPSCPVDFTLFAEYRDLVEANRKFNPDLLCALDSQFDAAMAELAVFALWLAASGLECNRRKLHRT